MKREEITRCYFYGDNFMKASPSALQTAPEATIPPTYISNTLYITFPILIKNTYKYKQKEIIL